MRKEAWHHCKRCGEMFHELNGHTVPAQGIAICEYCVRALREERAS